MQPICPFSLVVCVCLAVALPIKHFWSVEHTLGVHRVPLGAAQWVLVIGFGLSCSGCASQKGELLRERCAQLANRGYSDRAELIALLGENGLPVNGDDRALRQAAKQLCIAHL